MKVSRCFFYSYLQLVLKEVFHSRRSVVRVYLVIPESLFPLKMATVGKHITHKRFDLLPAPRNAGVISAAEHKPATVMGFNAPQPNNKKRDALTRNDTALRKERSPM